MKRLVCAALAGAVLLPLTACDGGGTSGTVQVSLAEPYTMTATFTNGALTGSAALSYLGKDAWQAEFTAPDSLAEVTLSYLDGNATASYKGLTFSVPQSAIPVKTGIGQLFEVLEAAGTAGELACKEQDGVCVIEDSLDAGEYVLKLNKKGEPVSFEMPNQTLEMTFTDFAAGSAQPGASETTKSPAETTAAAAETTTGVG